MTDPAVTRHSADDVPAMRDGLIDVHVDARADLLNQEFYTAESFGERLDHYAGAPAFSLVAGRIGDVLVGYAFGGTFSATTGWWTGLRNAADPDVTRETGSRTFALREILVRRDYQRRGYAHRLHDELLADRPEKRATLLVRLDNPAQQLYQRWGWREVGTLQPFPDAPIMHAMVLPLK